MYKAHAEKKRKESSSVFLQECLTSYLSSETDDDKLESLLEIAQCVTTNTFTDEDRATLLHQIGLEFITRLLKTTSLPDEFPSDLYKSIALSLLSSLFVEETTFLLHQPILKDFLYEINGILGSATAESGLCASSQSRVLEDSVDVVSHLARSESGINLLQQCGVISSLVEFALSSKCIKLTSVLRCLSLTVKCKGDIMFLEAQDKFHAIMALASHTLRELKDMKEKAEIADTLTFLLSGISMIDIPEHSTWVTDITQSLRYLLPLKLNVEDGTALLQLVCALVGAVGPQVLHPRLTGDATLMKSVVARLSVEVFMLLDNLDSANAAERYASLDRVYKMASDLVQYLAEGAEASEKDSLEADVIMAVYKRLVDVSNTIMEFLGSVARQEVDLPRNHIIVLISVRTLAAMLSEITEEPTPDLLELLPFFNLLCQTIEYSDDVKMEVKNATQAALENIKMMNLHSLTAEEEDGDSLPTSQSHNSVLSSSVSSSSSKLSSSSHSRPTTTTSQTMTVLLHTKLDGTTSLNAQDIDTSVVTIPDGSLRPSDEPIPETDRLVSTPQPPSLSKSSSNANKTTHKKDSHPMSIVRDASRDLGVKNKDKQTKSVSFSPQIDEKGDFGSSPSHSGGKRYHSEFQLFQRADEGEEEEELELSTGEFNNVNGIPDTEESECANSVESQPSSKEHPTSKEAKQKRSSRRKKQKLTSVQLSQETVEKFRTFQRALAAYRATPVPLTQRKMTFSARKSRFQQQKTSLGAAPSPSPPPLLASQAWQPSPEDVLGFLLPTYAFLLEHGEVLSIMVECDAFQTVTNFLHKSLSQHLEGETSVFPESMTMNGLSVVELVYTTAPSTAASLSCFQDLFELSVMSTPNLVSLPSPPTLICLKLIEVSLAAYKIQMRLHKRNSSIPRLKHSQPRFFRAIVEYLASFYVYRQHRRLGLVLRLSKDHRELWPLAEEYWCGALAGLSTLLRDVEELRDAYLKVMVLPEFLTFLHESQESSESIPEDMSKVAQSMLSLIESAVQASDKLGALVRQHHGLDVARKFRLKKLSKCLQGRQPQRSAAESDQS